MTASAVTEPIETTTETKPAKHERPPRPEISAEELTGLEALLARHRDKPEDRDTSELFHLMMDRYAEELILDSRHRHVLVVKLRQTRDKSNRRRSQLRQQNKTIELMQKRAGALYNAIMNTKEDRDAGQQQAVLLQNRLAEERNQRRSLENQLYSANETIHRLERLTGGPKP